MTELTYRLNKCEADKPFLAAEEIMNKLWLASLLTGETSLTAEEVSTVTDFAIDKLSRFDVNVHVYEDATKFSKYAVLRSVTSYFERNDRGYLFGKKSYPAKESIWLVGAGVTGSRQVTWHKNYYDMALHSPTCMYDLSKCQVLFTGPEQDSDSDTVDIHIYSV